MKKRIAIVIISIIILVISCIGYKIIKNPQEIQNNVEVTAKEEIGIFIENLITNSSDINSNITGIKFLTKENFKNKEEEIYKNKLIDIIVQQNQEKEWFELDNKNNKFNIEEIRNTNLETLLKNQTNKRDILEKIDEVIDLKDKLNQRYLKITYLNNMIVQTEETKNTISVFIQSNPLIDSQMERKYIKEIANIRNKTIIEYFGNKQNYTADELFLWDLNKEYEVLLFKLSKLPDVKPDITELKENLKKLNTSEINTNEQIGHPNNFILNNNKNNVETKLPGDLPLMTVPIEYKVDKQTHKLDLNTKVIRTILLETKTPFEEDIKTQ